MKIPKRPPITTSIGVCPCISLTGWKSSPVFSDTCFPRLFSPFANKPVESLTPIASRNTTRANQTEKTNKFDAIPSTKAMEVHKELTTAAWLDGIPPVRQISISTSSRFFFLRPLRICIIPFITWAPHRLKTVDKKIIFSKRDLNEVIITEASSCIYNDVLNARSLSRGRQRRY